MQMAHKPIKEENTSSIKMIIYGYKYICDIENVGFGLCNRLEPLGQQAVCDLIYQFDDTNACPNELENVGFGLCNRLEPLGQQAVILSINLTTQMHVPMS